MKRHLPLVLSLALGLSITGLASVDACANRLEAAYIEIQDLYEVELNAASQLKLLNVLETLCESPSTVTKDAIGTRYSTRGLTREKSAVRSHTVTPAWVGIDWYNGRLPQDVLAETYPPE